MFIHERARELVDVASADRHQQVALAQPGCQLALGGRQVAEPEHGPPAAVLGGGAGDVEAADPGQVAHRLLAGRVDVEHPDLVGGGEGGAEALGERPRARVQVRLEDGDQAARPELAHRLQGRGDLGRVMGVVVVDLGPGAGALALLAAQHPGELRQRLGGRFEREAGQPDGRQRGARVEDVVAPGHAELQRRPGAVGVEPLHPRFGGRRERVEGRVGAEREPGGARREATERVKQLRLRAPPRVMVELDVGDHGDLGAELEEAAVRLVGLGDHPLPRPPAGVGRPAVRARARELAPDQEGRVGARRAQRLDHHPGGRRLAVRAGDRDQPPQRAELGEQLPAVDDPLAALARPRQLRVVVSDRGRDDDLGALRHLLGVMTDPRLEARRPQALQVAAVGAVGARDAST